MDAWLAEVTSYLRSECRGNYVSLVLAGGYGRGWGAFTVSDTGPAPVNDLDLVLVTEKRLGRDIAAGLSHEATALISPGSRFATDSLTPLDLHADVMNLTRADFQKLPPTQFSYDLLESGRVIDGANILTQAPGFPAAQIDPAAALLSICNHSSSVYESFLVGRIAPEQMRLNLFSFATKAAAAAGSAVLLANRRYSALPDDRLRTIEGMVDAGDLSDLLETEPRFVSLVRDGTMERGFCSPERLARSGRHFEDARSAMMAAAVYCARHLLEASVDDPVGAARAISTQWRKEFLQTRGEPLWKSAARRALQLAGLRPVPQSWAAKAPVYASAIPLFAALSLDYSLQPSADDGATRAAAEILGMEPPAPGVEGWVRTAETMVVALKRQNWNR